MRYWLSFIIVVGLPVVLRLFRERKNKAQVFLCAYFITVLIITLGSRRADIVSHVALNPFHVYNTAFGVIAEGVQKYGWSELGKRIWWYRYQFGNLGLNVLLFMPLGYLLPVSIRRFDRWWKVLSLGFLFSLFIETVQLITRLGWFDASDLLHNIISNLIGGAIGAVLYSLIEEKNWSVAVSILLLCAGLGGCIITSQNIQTYETPFDFDIESVNLEGDRITLEGICRIYNRGSLNYQILLGNGDKTYPADTRIDGEQFKATAVVDGEDFKVEIQFQGYKPIDTSTFINGETVLY